MTATQSPPEPAPDRVRLAGCPLGGTPDVGLTAQDATTALGVPTRRRASSGGIPVATSMWRDAQTVRTYGPAVAKALALRVAGKARSRLTGRHCRKFMQLTDFDPFDPAIAADPYPHYRELLAGERVQYNPKRDVYILSRYADVREAARNHDTLSSARGVTFSRGWLPFLPTSDPPAHTRMRKQLAPGMARGALETWRPMVDQLARELVGGLLTQTPADVVSTYSMRNAFNGSTNTICLDIDWVIGGCMSVDPTHNTDPFRVDCDDASVPHRQRATQILKDLDSPVSVDQCASGVGYVYTQRRFAVCVEDVTGGPRS
ncbi:hypothetical protein GR254_04055 [Mycobacterium tuberculosis]|nr:hypothetical protein [Mycobacterium tuberculosis]